MSVMEEMEEEDPMPPPAVISQKEKEVFHEIGRLVTQEHDMFLGNFWVVPHGQDRGYYEICVRVNGSTRIFTSSRSFPLITDSKGNLRYLG